MEMVEACLHLLEGDGNGGDCFGMGGKIFVDDAQSFQHKTSLDLGLLRYH